MKGNIVSRVEHLKEVIRVIRQYIKIADVERKRHGEIMTPIDELALPMVNTVPVEFWSNPNSKILDSSAGVGTFLIICATKLMNGLKSWEPDDNKRFKHIVENMLYYGELQARNAFLWLCIIDPVDEYKTNTYCGSFLDGGFDKHMKEVWKIEKFDLIIQNPPYQKSVDASSDKPIWHLFVDKSMDILKDHGYMVMVHPSGWRYIKTFQNIKERLLSKDLKFLKMHSFKDGQKMFDAAINFDYYFLKNSPNTGNTKVICEDNESVDIDLSKLNIIPSENISEIVSLIAKDGEEKVTLLSNSSYHTQRNFMSREKTNDNIYQCIYTVKTSNLPTIRWSSLNSRGHFGLSKVIFARGASGVISDKIGEYGLTEFAYGIVDDSINIDGIKKALESDHFIKKIMLFKNSLGDRYNRKLIASFRKDFWRKFI
jgi:hypothetical protein